MSQILLTVSGKGGVGKTTLSAAAGYALSARGKKVLLIELDAGLRSLDVPLGLSEEITFDLADVLCNRCEPAKAIYRCADAENLFLLPAAFDAGFVPDAEKFSQLCNYLKKYWDYIIIDAPAGIGAAIFSAAKCADTVIIVSLPNEVAVRDAAKISFALNGLGNFEKRLVINLAERFSLRLFKSGDIDNIIDTVGARLLGIVPEDKRMKLFSAVGKPDFSSPSGIAVANIAARLDGETVPLKYKKF